MEIHRQAKSDYPTPAAEAQDAPPVAGGTDWLEVAGLSLVADGWMTEERMRVTLERVRQAVGRE